MTTKRKRKPVKYQYQAKLILSVTYKSDDVHDQSFYEMFHEIFLTAQREYRKYEFEIDDLRITGPPDSPVAAALESNLPGLRVTNQTRILLKPRMALKHLR